MTSFQWALCAALCWGITPLLEKAGLRGTDPQVGVLIRSVGVFIGLLGFLPWVAGMWPKVATMQPRQWLPLLAGGILASIIGQMCFYRALKFGEVSRVVPVGASYPVIAFALGILVLHESITPAKLCGVVLVTAGTFLLH